MFSGRFHSETIEDANYFFICIRYIHQNPVKARICNKIDEYKFTSIHAYKKDKGNYLLLVDTEYILRQIDRKKFIEFNKQIAHDKCMDVIESKMKDEEIAKMLYEISKCKNHKEWDQMSEAKKVYYIISMIDYGVPLMQLVRVSGLSYGKIQRLMKGKEGTTKNLTYEP